MIIFLVRSFQEREICFLKVCSLELKLFGMFLRDNISCYSLNSDNIKDLMLNNGVECSLLNWKVCSDWSQLFSPAWGGLLNTFNSSFISSYKFGDDGLEQGSELKCFWSVKKFWLLIVYIVDKKTRDVWKRIFWNSSMIDSINNVGFFKKW